MELKVPINLRIEDMVVNINDRLEDHELIERYGEGIDLDYEFFVDEDFDLDNIVESPYDPEENPTLFAAYVYTLLQYRDEGNRLTPAAKIYIWEQLMCDTLGTLDIAIELRDKYAEGTILKGRFEIGPSMCGIIKQGQNNWGLSLVKDITNNQVGLIKFLTIADWIPDIGREIRLLRQLNHPNVVTYWDSHEPESPYELPWVIMEYCNGGSLARKIEIAEHNFRTTGELLPEKLIWHFFKSVAEALRYCHYGDIGQTAGPPDWDPVYHRDIIPENIFTDKDARSVKLGDFGCAVRESDLNKIEDPDELPPLCSIPPEGEYPTMALDIYQLGKVIHALISPTNQVIGVPDVSFLDFPHGAYSDQLQIMVSNCVNENPDRRPDSRELLKAIEIFLESGTAGNEEVPLRY